MAKQRKGPDLRPLFLFDFGARETEETLRTRLLLEAETCLAVSGRPQRQMIEELRAYIVKNKSSDARIYPILRIIHNYVNVTPTDFRDLVWLLGLDKALDFIDGVRPPPKTWRAFRVLQDEGADPRYIEEYWNRVLDAIERGEDNEWVYEDLYHSYIYTNRGLRPGYRETPQGQPRSALAR